LQQQQSRKGNIDELQQVWKGEGRRNYKVPGRQEGAAAIHAPKRKPDPTVMS
jgi:hypothetical protein